MKNSEIAVSGWNEKEKKLNYFYLNNIQMYLKELSECTLNGQDMQLSSGLTDKNGKLIFEGDILETPIAGSVKIPNYLVGFGDTYGVMEDGFYGWYCESVSGEKKYCHLNKSIQVTSVVIGNIYENPELIK